MKNNEVEKITTISISSKSGDSASEISSAPQPPASSGKFWKALVDVTSAFLSVNLLSIPNALAISGWVLGFTLLLLLFAASLSVILVIGRLANADIRWVDLDLAGEDAFGGRAAIGAGARKKWALANLMRFVLMFEILMATANFALLSVDILLLLPAVRSVDFAWYYRWLFMVAVIAICALQSRLSETFLRALNAIGTVTTFLTLLVFVIFASKTGHSTSVSPAQPARIGLSLVIMNSFTAYPVFSRIYRTAETQVCFDRVVITNHVIVALGVGGIGAAGYLWYGQQVSAVVRPSLLIYALIYGCSLTHLSLDA